MEEEAMLFRHVVTNHALTKPGRFSQRSGLLLNGQFAGVKRQLVQ